MTVRIAGCLLLAALLLPLASLTSADSPAEQEPDRVRPLLEQRASVMADLVEYEQDRFERGLCDLRRLNESEKRLLAATLEITPTKAKRLMFLEKAVISAKIQLDQIELQIEAGRIPRANLIEARLAVLDAKIALERERAR